MNKDTIIDIYDKVGELRMVHFETVYLQHGIREGGDWRVYNPTHFMYVYSFFNTLYAIDWKSSIECGEIVSHPEGKYEKSKIGQMISFCTSDPLFRKKYKSIFLKIITNIFSEERIDRIIDTIVPDTNPLGNIGNDEIYSLRSNVLSLFKGNFYRSTITEIMKFIFCIRNNIFHGTKTLNTMLEAKQQTKLLLYSYFIIAVNQMLFSYLDYLYEKTTGKKVEGYDYNHLIKILENLKTSGVHMDVEEDDDDCDDEEEL